MKTERAFEVAESFLNGNISWVKARTKSKKAFLAVLAALEDIHPTSIESFKRLCG